MIHDLLQRAFDQYHHFLGYPLDDPTLWERIADELPDFPEPDETEAALEQEFNAGYAAATPYTSLDEDEAAAAIQRHARLLCGTADRTAVLDFIEALNADDVTLCTGDAR